MIKITIKKLGYSKNDNWYYHVKYFSFDDDYEYYFQTLDLDSNGSYNRLHSKLLRIGKISDSDMGLLLSVEVPEYLGKEKSIKWRLDNGKTIEDNWIKGRTNLFFPGDFSALETFVKELLQSDKIYFEIQTHNRTLYPKFNLEGLGEVIYPYLPELGLEKFRSLIETKKTDY